MGRIKTVQSTQILARSLQAFLVAALVIGLALVAVPMPTTAQSTTWYVDDDTCPDSGSGTQGDPYCSIQDAIDAATAGDTINVAAGTYTESVTVNKANLTLQSESLHGAIIQGNVDVSNGADGVTIDGFRIEPSSGDAVHIRTAGNVTVTQNEIVGNGPSGGVDGIVYTHSAPTNPGTVSDNTIEDCELGIYIDHDGLDGFTVSGNTIENNRKAIGMGSGSGATITGNTVTNSTDIGIEIFKADISEAHDNEIVENSTGVYNGDSTNIFDATNNWWGAASGPTHSSNPSGTGDSVSDNVDFDPWTVDPETGASTSEVVSSDTGSAALSDDVVTASYTGSGTPTITLAKYDGNPGTGLIGASDDYFDIHVSGAAAGATLDVTLDTSAAEGDPLYWFNGTSWQLVIDNDGSTIVRADASGDYSFTLGDNSSPTLGQLNGTPFGSAEDFGIAAQVSASTLALNDTITVDILAKASDLWAVDFTLNFNVDDGDGETDDVLEGTSVSLPSVSDSSGMNAAFVVEQDIDNGDGTVWVAYSQKGDTDEAASGDGFLLATITFRGQNLGDADLEFGPVIYTDADGTIIADELTLELLIVDTSDAELLSPHVTVTSAAVVTGNVDLQGRGDDGGVDARLTPGNYFDTTDAAGDFTVTEVPAGTFILRISMLKYLAAEKSINIPDPVTSSTGHEVELLGGDINQDDRINIQDLAMMGARFGSQDTDGDWDTFGSVADINDDGQVNIQDLAIAGSNFGKETSDYSW